MSVRLFWGNEAMKKPQQKKQADEAIDESGIKERGWTLVELKTAKVAKQASGNGMIKPSKLGNGFSYWRTVIFVFALILGVVGTMLFQNVVSAEATTFSTIGLVGFMVCISLSVAAIFLAIAAVTLGYVAQRAIKEQGEEAWKMQNEAFMRTIDTLMKIESSVGVHSG